MAVGHFIDAAWCMMAHDPIAPTAAGRGSARQGWVRCPLVAENLSSPGDAVRCRFYYTSHLDKVRIFARISSAIRVAEATPFRLSVTSRYASSSGFDGFLGETGDALRREHSRRPPSWYT